MDPSLLSPPDSQIVALESIRNSNLNQTTPKTMAIDPSHSIGGDNLVLNSADLLATAKSIKTPKYKSIASSLKSLATSMGKIRKEASTTSMDNGPMSSAPSSTGQLSAYPSSSVNSAASIPSCLPSSIISAQLRELSGGGPHSGRERTGTLGGRDRPSINGNGLGRPPGHTREHSGQHDRSNENSNSSMDGLNNFGFPLVHASQEVIQVRVKWRLLTANVKISQSLSVYLVIEEIQKKFQLQEQETTSFILGRVDRQTPGMRIWFDSDAFILLYGLLQGDELLLHQTSEMESVKVAAPPSNVSTIFEYDHKLLAGEIIKQMKEKLGVKEEINCGLYISRLGMWLDASKPLISYEIGIQTIQFRALANEQLVRVLLEEFNQKIAIKVLPSFTIDDVLSIIAFQVSNRKLSLAKGSYGVMLPSSNEWLSPTSVVGELETIKTETITYKIQHYSCKVKVDENNIVETFVDSIATVSDFLNLFFINENTSLDTEFALFAPDGTALKEKDLLSKTLKDLPEADFLTLKSRPTQVTISCTAYPDFIWSVDLDVTKSLQYYAAIISRKFGYPEENLLSILKQGQDKPITADEMSNPITRLKLTGSPSLTFDFKPIPPQKDVKEISPLHRHPTVSSSGHQGFSLTALVDKLTDSHQEGTGIHHHGFAKTFQLTYQSFTNATELMEKLVVKYSVQNYDSKPWKEFDENRKLIQLRVINSLLQWIKKYPGDFLHTQKGKENRENLLSVVQNVLEVDHPAAAKQLRKYIFKLGTTPSASLSGLAALPHNLNQNEQAANTTIFSTSHEEIAEQFTVIESLLFRAVMPFELLGQAWSKKDSSVLAPNIVALSKRFNSVATWVSQSILEMPLAKQRGERITKLIDIAAHFIVLNNYSSLMSIIAGLNKASISRLKLSFKEVPARSMKKKMEIEILMSALGSYKNYRASIRSVAPPAVPYIGTFLTDLTYIEDGNPDNIDGLINFSKRELAAKSILELLEHQQTPYNTIKQNSIILGILNSLPEFTEKSEKQLWLISKTLE